MNDIKPINILIVDDNEDDVYLIKKAINDVRLVNIVNVLYNGHEALSYLRKQGEYEGVATPGLVLLDINMPIMDGFEVLDEMKNDDELRTIPVVMLTTSSRDEDVIKAYTDGACSFISKPVSMESFTKAMEYFSLYWAMVCSGTTITMMAYALPNRILFQLHHWDCQVNLMHESPACTRRVDHGHDATA